MMNENSDKSDEDLIQSYQLGKNPYFLGVIFTRYSDVGFRTAMRYLHNQSDAEDVLQLSYIQFIQNLDQFQKGSSSTVKPWLMKIIVNTSLYKLREEKYRARRQQKVASQRYLTDQQEGQSIDNSSEKEELKQKIQTCVDSLPEKYRSPIWLILYEGFSYPEVATVLALPEKTVRTQVARGIERLKSILGSLGSVLSLDAILLLIAESKLDGAPESITKIIHSPELYEKIATKSQKVAIYSSKPVASSVSKYLIIGLTVISSLVGFYYWKYSSPPTTIISKTSNNSINLALDFNNTEEKNPYIYSGNYQIMESGGLNKSGCLELNNFFTMKIPVEIDQLPLKITYRYNTKFRSPSENSELQFETVWGGWVELGLFLVSPTLNSKIKIITREYIFDKDSDWVDVTVWATENCLDYWINGKRFSVYIFSSSEPNKNLYLRFPPKIKIDNLSIKTVTKSECTDISQFIKLNKEISKAAKTSLTQMVTPINKYFPQYKLPNFDPVHVIYNSCSEEENAEYFMTTEWAVRKLKQK